MTWNPFNDRPGNSISRRGVASLLAAGVMGLPLPPRVQAVADAAIVAEGTYNFKQSPLGGDELVADGWFRAEVSGCRWRITTAAARSDLTNTGAAYCCYSFDGESLYRLTSLGAGIMDGPSSKRVIRKTGIVSDGNFPVFDPSGVTFIWAAFASGCYLRENGLRRSRPIWAASAPSFVSDRGYLRTEVSGLEGERGLPARIAFFLDGDAFIDAANPGDEVIKYPPPYDRGFLKAQYRVTEQIRSGRDLFPQAFTLEVFNPLPTGKSSNELHKVWRLTGRVRDLRRTEPPRDWRPAIVELVSIVDLRFSREGVPSLEYASTGWRARTDADLRLSLSRAKEFKAKEEKRHDSVRKVVLAVLTLSAAALLCFAWWKRGSVQNQAGNSKQERING